MGGGESSNHHRQQSSQRQRDATPFSSLAALPPHRASQISSAITPRHTLNPLLAAANSSRHAETEYGGVQRARAAPRALRAALHGAQRTALRPLHARHAAHAAVLNAAQHAALQQQSQQLRPPSHTSLSNQQQQTAPPPLLERAPHHCAPHRQRAATPQQLSPLKTVADNGCSRLLTAPHRETSNCSSSSSSNNSSNSNSGPNCGASSAAVARRRRLPRGLP